MEIRRIEKDDKAYKEMEKLKEEILLAPIGYTLSEKEKAEETRMISIGGFAGGKLIATLAMEEYDENTVRIGRFAVRQDMQGSGFGRELLSYAEDVIKKMEYANAVVHARKTAVGFYRKCGYFVEGEDFVEATILHVKMIKKL